MSLLKDVVVFLGPPGSGKGTLSQLCVKHLGWQQLSTGNLCRKHITEQTEIGKAIDFAIKSGKLVSDGLISQMVSDWFKSDQHKASVAILDGYPRTVTQAEYLQRELQNTLSHLTLRVVLFDISDERVAQRLGSRFVCERKDCQAVYSTAQGSLLSPKEALICDACGGSLARRKDDSEDAVQARLKTYHQHAQALLDFYERVGQPVITINADRPLEQVFADLKLQMGVEVA